MRNKTLLAAFTLSLLLMTAAMRAQPGPMPEFAPPVPGLFGLESPTNLSNGQIRLRLVDIDHDGTVEAFVRSATNAPPYYEPQDLWYFENEGSNEAPYFVFAEPYPFGLPGLGLDWVHQFVDIDGDGLDEVFFTGFIFDNPVKMRENKGTPEVPDFSDSTGGFIINPYGITMPVSEIDGGQIDGIFPTFVDIDNDGDYDLFFGGRFTNNQGSSAFHFSENVGTATDPQFALPTKNPYGLIFPPEVTGEWRFAFEDTDCDGDQDLYMLGFPVNKYYYFENTGAPGQPVFGVGVDMDPALTAFAGSFLDIGGDGDLDLITASSPSTFLFYENLSAPEVVDFSYTQAGHAFDFTDNSSDNATAWRWDFGDGTTSDLQNPHHSYSQNGAYEVCLTAWGDLECSNTVCKKVYTPVFPWHGAPEPDPFGLIDHTAPDTVSGVRLVDIDNDGAVEAFVWLFDFKRQADSAACLPHRWWCWWDFRFYENNGDNAAPDFVFQESFPFGIPYDSIYWPDNFVDIDGDNDYDLTFHRFDFNHPLVFLENTGTAETPVFGNSEFQFNPFGIELPVSDSIPGDPYDQVQPFFVDIDNDNDYDFFLGGNFRYLDPANNPFDENYYFYRNDADGSGSQFTGPFKNPFNLGRPPVFTPLLTQYSFADMDCDGDWDMFAHFTGRGISYHENIGTPGSPDFGSNPVVWLATDGPPPPGYFGYLNNSMIDVGSDGGLDMIQGGFAGISFWENISHGAMACLGPIPVTGTTSARLDARLTLYPNPANGLLGISLQSDKPLGELEIQIFDMLGQRIKWVNRQAAGNMLQEAISVEGLADGAYLLKVSSEGKSITQKFIKMQ